jgi:hypothetical protein
MNFLLEIASHLSVADRAQLFDRRLQKLSDVAFNLFAQAGVLQSLQQCRMLDVGKSAA